MFINTLQLRPVVDDLVALGNYLWTEIGPQVHQQALIVEPVDERWEGVVFLLE